MTHFSEIINVLLLTEQNNLKLLKTHDEKASFQEEEENPTEKSYKLDALETTKHRK